MLITLKEYAAIHGKAASSVRQKAERGGFSTAVRKGRDWFIDDDEPYIDRRVVTGKYVAAREKKQKK